MTLHSEERITAINPPVSSIPVEGIISRAAQRQPGLMVQLLFSVRQLRAPEVY
jgi:hypothetical protein